MHETADGQTVDGARDSDGHGRLLRGEGMKRFWNRL